jgi:hypothetical protein
MKYIIRLTIDSEVEDLSEILDFCNEEIANMIPDYLEGALVDASVEHYNYAQEVNDIREDMYVNSCVLFKTLSHNTFMKIFEKAFQHSSWISEWKYNDDGSYQIWSKLVDFKEDLSGKEINPERMRRSIIQIGSLPNKYASDLLVKTIRKVLIDSVEEPTFDEVDDTFHLEPEQLDNWVCDAIIQWACFKEIKFGSDGLAQ